MEQKAWIKGTWGRTESGREAKFYSLTRAGERALAQQAERWRRPRACRQTPARELSACAAPSFACCRRFARTVPNGSWRARFARTSSCSRTHYIAKRHGRRGGTLRRAASLRRRRAGEGASARRPDVPMARRLAHGPQARRPDARQVSRPGHRQRPRHGLRHLRGRRHLPGGESLHPADASGIRGARAW